MNSLMPAFLIKLPAYAGGFDSSETCFCDGRFAPAASLFEVKRPREEMGAVGSIELMVAMAVVAIATFRL